VIYTISNLIIADALPASKQSLAGGVFNTVSQIKNSVGLTISAVISATVITTHAYKPSSAEALEKGFRATVWFCFAAMFSVIFLSFVGLKKAGKVGLQSD
jgi:hypothetical protein